MIRAALVLALFACSTSKTAEHDLHLQQQQDLAAGEHLRVDRDEQADLDQHTIDTSAPGLDVDRRFAPLPDGGTYLERERLHITGERKIEAWQLAQIGADEHIEYDAGVSLRTSATVDDHDESAKSMKPASGCMLGLGFWGAIAIAALLGAAILYLKFKP